MSEYESGLLGNARLKEAELIPYGFHRDGDGYLYIKRICNGDFELHIKIENSGTMDSKVIDFETQEPYVLYKLPSVHGDYVGAIREEVKSVIKDIKEHCYIQGDHTTPNFFFVRDYCLEQYQEELEYLWHDENCILRRKDNRKWYAVIMRVSLRKLGLEEDKKESIIALRGDTSLIDNECIFPAYHLNKKSWVSVVLDERTPKELLIQRIEESRELALGKGKKK